MANLRCFDTYNASNFTASDYIRLTRRKTLFQNAQTIAIGNASYQTSNPINSVSPGYHLKKTGGRYLGPVHVNPNTTTTQNGCLIAANSYELLYDVINGSHASLNNFDINDVISITGEAWLGTFASINYPDKGINCVILNTPNGNCNTMNYPNEQDYEPDPTGTLTNFPGMIVDPSYQVFYPTCESVKGNNYNKNVTFIFDKIAEQNPELLKYLSTFSFSDFNQFPYPLNFNSTSCNPNQ